MKALNILLVVVLFSFLSSSNAEEKDGSTLSNVELESLREIIDQAGYKSKLFFDNRIALGFQEFVQFGSYSKGKKFREGDAFDKIDIKKETSEHRDSILKRRFVIDKLEFKSNFEDVETKGVLAEVVLPFRIAHEKKYERFTSTGVLSGRPHPLDATGDYSFLTKDGKLQRCIGNGQVLQVRNSNGVLYRAENKNSVLVLVLKGDISTLKQIARNPKDYSISIELTGLRSEPPDTWGFYKETALEKENWDSEWLRYFWPPLLEDKQPDYFVIAHKSDNNDKIPEIAMATMVSLAVMDNKKGEIIGGYNLKSSGLNKDTTKTKPPATKVDLTKDLTKVVAAIEKEMVLIPAGKFMMGSPESEKGRSNDEKQHSVTLTNPFYMGKYEVTQDQWEAVMGNNPSIIKGAKLPVTNVSWEDCQEFIKKLNAKTGGGYRLPTEAEWEYACRAGTTTAYSFGDEISPKDANYYSSAINKPVEVGNYKRNAFGIFDLHGNVWEWCEDWYGDYPAEEVTDPKGSATGDGKVMRGGSFSYNVFGIRSSNRSYSKPPDRVGYTGFRLARTGDLKAGASLTAPRPDPAGVKPASAKLDLTKVVAAIEKEMVLIPAGKFMMGSPESEKGRDKDETQHEVTLTKPFYMGKYEVTQEQWEAVMGNNPSSKTKGSKLPVTDVSWEDCQEFIKKLNASTKGGYRLPYEAEWEYACRAGTTTPYSFGDSLTKIDANIDGSSLKAVGSYKANGFGLYDMHGNVWEWCEDWKENYPKGSATDPKGPVTGAGRVLRGGAFWNEVSSARSSGRNEFTPDSRHVSPGLRLARTVDLKAEDSIKVPKTDTTKVTTALGKLDFTKAAAAIEKEMVLIPAGKFMMGSPATEKGRSDNETQHEVTLTKSFYMGKYEVTQEQWEAVMGYNPDDTKGSKLPVTDVSWEGCQEFIKKLNAKTNGGYRLPTEAEWEYACRARTTTAYSFGDTITPEDVNNDTPKINKHKDEDGVMIVVKTHKPNSVGAYKPNAFGLYDMHGNVCEWCEDWYGDYPAGSVMDPKGPLKGEKHVVRGGSVSVSSRNVVVEGGESEFHKDIRFFPGKSSTRFGLANPVPNVIGLRLAKTADLKAGASLTAPKPDPAGVKPAVGNLLVAPFTETKAKEAQKEVAKILRKEVEEKADLGKGIKLELVLIPAGKFQMGSPDNETQHEVTLTKPFYMGKYEVTQEQWESVMGNNPSDTKGAKLPVTDVSWLDCQDFIKKLNATTKGGYRLPTEAEWEYAARAGTKTAYSFGDIITPKDANYGESKIDKPVTVGSYKSNAFGLYDMHGNVREWVGDWGDKYPKGPVTDPLGPDSGELRVMRGGSFHFVDSVVYPSIRYYFSPTIRILDNVGFRLVRTP